MYCSNCGNKCEESDTFCKKCGSHIYENHDFTDAMPNNVQDQADRFKQDDRYDMGDRYQQNGNFSYGNQNNNQYNNGYQQYNRGEYVPTEQDKKNKRTAIILTIVIAVLAIVIPIIIFVVLFVNIFGSLKSEFLELGNHKVYNVVNFVKDADVCGCNINKSGIDHDATIDLRICNMDEVRDDIDRYFDYMVFHYDYKRVDDNKIRYKSEDGYIIEIWVDKSESYIFYWFYGYDTLDEFVDEYDDVDEGTHNATEERINNDADVSENMI